MLLRSLSVFGVAVVLAGCSAARDPASDYRVVREVPPLVIPPGVETRPIKPLYPVPPGPVPREWPKKFKAPPPEPLVLSDAAPAEKAADSAETERPVLTRDGNGYPLISVVGDVNVVWDGLDQALRKAGIKVDDRDQRIGLYYLRLSDEVGKDTPYQLRLTRGQTAYTMTLQKDDDTLAPRTTTQSLFEAIVANWPEAGQP